ncbi:DUF2613 domain-containing protein [Skermania piniformis]|uniref:DUF2613 domain-containing protein n=1 Tax=Skermania pinensis TaxID=39122 RepID=A0ABX8S7H6_9ACTN|nr:DUF2613 domain-containing protein [Skermania piniformis]QXQ13777.1 DUF2613 domain-containing protein [Skermania piniformis]
MDGARSFLGPGAASAVAGMLLGVVAVFGIVAAAQQNSRPDIDRSGNAGSSLLNQVEYGSR